MHSATELMARAARYRRLANRETDPRVRAELMQIALDYDGSACAKLLAQEVAGPKVRTTQSSLHLR
jgi:hypothetical protein